MTTETAIRLGEEIIRISANGTVSYEYCAANGEVFQQADKSIEEARKACANWLLTLKY